MCITLDASFCNWYLAGLACLSWMDVLRRPRSSNIIQLEILGRWMHRLSSWDRCCGVRMVALYCICEGIPNIRAANASTRQMNCALFVVLRISCAWHMQDLDHFAGSNCSALVSLVEGSLCSWLYMLKAWVASKKGKKKGRPCSFEHCCKTRRSWSILCAWLISMRTRTRGSTPPAKG